MSKLNAAGINVEGDLNPNWRGGNIVKVCQQCGTKYKVRPGYKKSKFCSIKCVGLSQKGERKDIISTKIRKTCEVCGNEFEIFKAYDKRQKCCSKKCSFERRSQKMKGEKNHSWKGGLSRIPYTYDWLAISKKIRNRDGHKCMNPLCSNKNSKGKIEVHHIDHDKTNNSDGNLITLCSVCNSKANYNRNFWVKYYKSILKKLFNL